ncbi:hypothetical protein [Psychrobacter sp. MES7-P7E]|uniref:hypothetical protein n=1 Tax=Psychrobacter sp. MES7-P7E TaxID=2058322 RepID=UPI000C7F5DBA|nr:hypothetical protein [Psychrobacter sp. MES7-P7E]PLT21154.1 hypothetical protein CXF62_11685 [Psychrobacter sp. MES7-P7E]
MSALDGLAQFGLSMTNSYMANKEKIDNKKAAEEEKQYQRGREKVTDLRAQERFDIEKASAQIKLKNEQQGAADVDDERGYKQTYNQYQYSRSVGDTNGAINAIISGTNSNSKIPFKVDVERDETGKPVERKDDKGNVYYYQNVYDKDTGELMMSSTTTADGLLESFNKLENASEIAAANAAYAAAKKKKQEEDQSELSLYTAKKGVDVEADKIKTEYNHGYTVDEIELRHDNAIELANLNTENGITRSYAEAGISQGQNPNIVSGGDAASGIVRVISAGKGYTQYELADGRVITAKGNRNFRNNNLGNIEYGDFAKRNGAVGTDGRFAVFPDRATGIKAMENLIFGTGSYRNLTLTDAINRYAPPHENQTNRYQSTVLQAVGGQNKPMSQYSAAEREAIIQAMAGVEGKNNTRYTNGSGVKVSFSQPIQPKAAKGSSKSTQAQSGEGITNTKSYNANIDKGVNTALKGVKSLGIKSDATTTATFARAGTKLKEMGKAKSEQEFLGLYQEAFDLVLDAVPERSRSKMSKADQNALGHKVLLSMVGASSLGNLKDIVYRINPSAKGSGSVSAGGLTLPGQQARTPSRPVRQTSQTGKLQALYSRGLPAPQTDPAAAESFDYMNNLNDNIDW